LFCSCGSMGVGIEGVEDAYIVGTMADTEDCVAFFDGGVAVWS
jgi:hypothetical protein